MNEAQIVFDETSITVDHFVDAVVFKPIIKNIGKSKAGNVHFNEYTLRYLGNNDDILPFFDEIFSDELVHDLQQNTNAYFGMTRIDIDKNNKGKVVMVIFKVKYFDSYLHKEKYNFYFFNLPLIENGGFTSLSKTDFIKVEGYLLDGARRVKDRDLEEFILSKLGKD